MTDKQPAEATSYDLSRKGDPRLRYVAEPRVPDFVIQAFEERYSGAFDLARDDSEWGNTCRYKHPHIQSSWEGWRDGFISLTPAPAEATPVAWSVKPLEWKKSDPRDSGRYCDTPFGRYMTWTYHEAAGRWFWSLRPLYGPHIADGECASETEATAAVEADYEQRITSAIIVHPDPRAKAAEAVPEGMVLVPREPTEAMRDAGFAAPYQAPMAVYRAMLAAAPQPLSTAAVK